MLATILSFQQLQRPAKIKTIASRNDCTQPADNNANTNERKKNSTTYNSIYVFIGPEHMACNTISCVHILIVVIWCGIHSQLTVDDGNRSKRGKNAKATEGKILEKIVEWWRLWRSVCVKEVKGNGLEWQWAQSLQRSSLHQLDK